MINLLLPMMLFVPAMTTYRQGWVLWWVGAQLAHSIRYSTSASLGEVEYLMRKAHLSDLPSTNYKVYTNTTTKVYY